MYACFCNYGYTDNAGGKCSACAAGTYKDTRGIDTCKSCPTNSTSEAAAASVEECECLPGFEPADGACALCAAGKVSDGTEPCTECADGEYAPDAGRAVCLVCPGNSFSSQDHSFYRPSWRRLRVVCCGQIRAPKHTWDDMGDDGMMRRLPRG